MGKTKNLLKDLSVKKKEFQRKHVYIAFLIFLFISLIAIYWANFTGESSFLRKTNPFIKIFGQKNIDITEYYNIKNYEGNSMLTLDIFNFIILYNFSNIYNFYLNHLYKLTFYFKLFS